MNLQRREGKIDLLHIVLLSFLFQDLPGLWPLTKNCVLLLFKLKELVRNCPWEMQSCVCCKDVRETRIHWVTHYSFYQHLGEMPLDVSRVVGFPVNQEFIFVLWILWMSSLDRFSSSCWLPRSLKLISWSTFKRLVWLTCILYSSCISLHVFFSLLFIFFYLFMKSGGR